MAEEGCDRLKLSVVRMQMQMQHPDNSGPAPKTSRSCYIRTEFGEVDLTELLSASLFVL